MFPSDLTSLLLLGQNYPDPFFQLAILFGGLVLAVVYVVLAIVGGILVTMLAMRVVRLSAGHTTAIPGNSPLPPGISAKGIGLMILALALSALSLPFVLSPFWTEGGILGWCGMKWDMHQQTEPLVNGVLSMLVGIVILFAALVPAFLGCVVADVRRYQSRAAATPA
jgi:hypothetical protein